MNTQARTGIFFPSLDIAPLNSVPELSKVTQTEIMVKKIDRLELAILSDVFSTVDLKLPISKLRRSYRRDNLVV